MQFSLFPEPLPAQRLGDNAYTSVYQKREQKGKTAVLRTVLFRGVTGAGHRWVQNLFRFNQNSTTGRQVL